MSTKVLLIPLLVVSWSFAEATEQADNVRVCLSDLGCLEGTNLPGFQSGKFEAFLGVPFAEAPIGPLRFKNPLPVKPWNDTLITKTIKPDCLQKNYLLDDWFVTGSEDCLYLNIYRPAHRPDRALPVMFYIFGGGFFTGSINPDMMDPAYFMDTQEVILVLANYRLGPFGFLSTGSVDMPGNFGLKDQQLALKWIQAHISDFGGDPQAVTIFGHSAGAAAVHLHMLNEASKDLFRSAILGSGNALGPYVDVIDDPYRQALKFAEYAEIDYPEDMDAKDLSELLRAVDAYTIINAGDALKTWQRFPLFNFRPTIEHADWPDAFLIEKPKDSLKAGKILRIPTMQSLVSDRGEGAVYTLRIWTHENLRKNFNGNFNSMLWYLMELPLKVTPQKRMSIIDVLVKEYLDDQREVNNSTIKGLTELFSDLAFYYPFWKSTTYTLSQDDKSSPIYVLKFNYYGSKSRAFVYNGGIPIEFGVCVHMDELPYLFRSPSLFLEDFEKDSADARLVKELVNIYVDFAKNGDVKGLDPCSIDGFNGESRICNYMEFSNHVGTGYRNAIHNEFNTKRMMLWDQILDEHIQEEQ